MHDLISSRAASFAGLGIADGMAVLGVPQEAALLAQAGLIIAIQPEEAAAVRGLLPAGPAVITVPMAMAPAAAAQPGEGHGLLFVGSGTAPNVDAMLWFLDEIWPLIRARRADATLTLAGMVCGKLGAAAHRPGVRVLGRVADLAPLYRRADVIISPLRAGSGLKIKLIEALAHGKAVVATSRTAQGVEDLVAGTVILADTPRGFAAGVLHLLAHPRARLTRAKAGLDIARQHFAPAADLATALHTRLASTRPLEEAAFDWPFVTIVVPCLNEERYIGACLASLTAQYAAGRHEILVVDGGRACAGQSAAFAICCPQPGCRPGAPACHHHAPR
jgi:succinoglycan biosynthesis protein ExoO